jgi:hypothetical protein
VSKSKRETGNHSGQSARASAFSESIEAREYVWLDDIRQGTSTRSIAAREGLSCRRIQLGAARARAREASSRIGCLRGRDELRMRDSASTPREPRHEPRLVPLFPIGPFTPQSVCPHRGAIRPGSVFCCMVCSRSGMDDHPALKRDPRSDPRPEVKAAKPTLSVSGRETRKERRRRLFATQPATPEPTAAVE